MGSLWMLGRFIVLILTFVIVLLTLPLSKRFVLFGDVLGLRFGLLEELFFFADLFGDGVVSFIFSLA